jgi:glycosyltransferase involved in cell wall biosynthesis
MKVLLLSRYGPLGASSRVRFLQYLPYFQSQGVEVTVKPLLSDSYLRALYNGGSRWREVLKGYAGRVLALLGTRRFDMVIIEKELFPFMPAIAERLLRLIGVPYVVDYDDALFHRYDYHANPWVRRLLGQKIDSVMRHAATVIAGNKYLAERACRAGANRVEIIPTVVDTERYQPKQKAVGEVPIVGWVGTPQTSRYLKPLLPVFESLKNEMPVRFVAVGANPEDFEGTPVEAWPWSEDSEVESVQQFDIGIMPLEDSPWERGKCGYKLIQYMACGVPVVASPVGVNVEIVEEGKNGRLADLTEQWELALRELLTGGSTVRKNLGNAGRELVEKRYSAKAQGPRLYQAIVDASSHKGSGRISG